LSIAEMTPRIPSKLDTSEERACFCIVRRRVNTAIGAIASMSGVRAWRLILYWPLLNRKIVDVDARGRNRDCQE
jgi:hypothetical protein